MSISFRIAFYKGKYWHDFIASNQELFDSTKIIKYAGFGISVTSKSSKLLSQFICDMEEMNQDIIPQTESVARLGYIGDGSRFSPYVEDIIFDGDANYGTIYDAITQKGNYTTWLEEALKCRKESLTAHVMLAASFASVLINKIGCLPFFVHLWGVESGTGKTVALMLAASVWGIPKSDSISRLSTVRKLDLKKRQRFLTTCRYASMNCSSARIHTARAGLMYINSRRA